ncbi:MAG: SLBB domain-containing protein [Chloroflexi bacterium]|nr:SLBB domain-containing protein [Chloroflexota bacterium]
MTANTAATAYDALAQAANKRSSTQTRFIVQVGHCSQSVGAHSIAEEIERLLPNESVLVIAGCDGACFDAPQVIVRNPSGSQTRFTRVTPADIPGIITGGNGTDGDDRAFFSGQHRLTLDGCGETDPSDIDDYISGGGYAGLAKALSSSPEDVIAQVKDSGLRGRGGAYFPVALKWQGARGVDRTPRYLVVNSEEGEPGIFKDRHLMEGVPHRILEGATIAAYAAGAEQAYIYINAEAELSAARMQTALEQAYDGSLLGRDILGSGFDLEVEIRHGAGGYVCGEETTLLNTMEGDRREPRLRPPFPTESGLLARPTVINNPETLASVPFILAKGADAFAAIGTESDKGTKIVSVSGSVRRPGIAEVPMGTTLREIVYEMAGGPEDGQSLTAIAVGGPSSGILPPSMLDTAIKPGLLHESGVMLGAGGIIALDERVGVVEMLRKLAAYNADESCGKCTPCREGTPRIVDAVDRLLSGSGSLNDLEEARYLANVVNSASLCGLGQAAGNPVTSVLHFFGEELAELVGVR